MGRCGLSCPQPQGRGHGWAGGWRLCLVCPWQCLCGPASMRPGPRPLPHGMFGPCGQRGMTSCTRAHTLQLRRPGCGHREPSQLLFRAAVRSQCSALLAVLSCLGLQGCPCAGFSTAEPINLAAAEDGQWVSSFTRLFSRGGWAGAAGVPSPERFTSEMGTGNASLTASWEALGRSEGEGRGAQKEAARPWQTRRWWRGHRASGGSPSPQNLPQDLGTGARGSCLVRRPMEKSKGICPGSGVAV